MATYILHEGYGFDGKTPIVVLLKSPETRNAKIGRMWQIWTLLADMHPTEAIRLGEDSAICGECPLRPFTFKQNRDRLQQPCYVNPMALASMYRAFKRGSYKPIDLETACELIRKSGVPLRFGAYAESTLLPIEYVKALASAAVRHTGYTHAWLLKGFNPEYLQHLMVSIDPVSKQLRAPGMAGRSYRVINSTAELADDEILCPSSRGVQCADCGLCAGLDRKAKNVAIVAH